MEEERPINVDTGAGGLDNLPFKATISKRGIRPWMFW